MAFQEGARILQQRLNFFLDGINYFFGLRLFLRLIVCTYRRKHFWKNFCKECVNEKGYSSSEQRCLG